ncbi:MAG TPA: hypothetical protein VMY38_05615 [Gemmatimonadaceae bacterium]|nr:hypothetical protein [Gemmatimonadaceae bacterium]
MMYAREFRAHVGSRIGALLLGAVLLVAAGVFLTFGVVLIVGMIAIGLVVGIAAALYRRLAGSPPAAPRRESFSGLDPALEVLPPPPIVERKALDSVESKHSSS